MQNSNTSLAFSEWLFFVALFLILSGIVAVAKIQANRQDVISIEKPMLVEVVVTGHVSKQGSYKVEKGTPLIEVLKESRPLPDANLESFLTAPIIYANYSVEVEKLDELIIYIEGACQTGQINVPIGTRLCDLKKVIQLDPEADLRFFKKKRCVKNKEIIKIPFKNVDKKKVRG